MPIVTTALDGDSSVRGVVGRMLHAIRSNPKYYSLGWGCLCLLGGHEVVSPGAVPIGATPGAAL